MEVANVVTSIISAYSNGRDLFRRMIGKKAKKRGREPTLSEREAWLRESLDRRPQQIRDSYNRSVARFGQRFEEGDAIAHSSLAHTLLVLNSGLINLINHDLHRDSKYDPASSQALLDLSEAAATSTIGTLSQLNARLASQVTLSSRTLPGPQAQEHDEKKHKKSSEKTRPGPTPAIRGAWVRPKSSSVVSASSSKPRKNKKTHERSRSEPSLPASAKTHASKPRTRTPSPSRPEEKDAVQHRRKKHHSPPHREPSMLLVPSDMFLPLHEGVTRTDVPPPRPPKIPLHSRPNPSSRPRPPSAATFLTTSTKIGEIPQRGAAYTNVPNLEQQVRDPRLVEYIPQQTMPAEGKPKKIRKGFKFWKKEQTPVAVPAC